MQQSTSVSQNMANEEQSASHLYAAMPTSQCMKPSILQVARSHWHLMVQHSLDRPVLVQMTRAADQIFTKYRRLLNLPHSFSQSERCQFDKAAADFGAEYCRTLHRQGMQLDTSNELAATAAFLAPDRDELLKERAADGLRTFANACPAAQQAVLALPNILGTLKALTAANEPANVRQAAQKAIVALTVAHMGAADVKQILRQLPEEVVRLAASNDADDQHSAVRLLYSQLNHHKDIAKDIVAEPHAIEYLVEMLHPDHR